MSRIHKRNGADVGNDARQRAWAHAATGNNRLFLLAIAEFIQDGRHTCWPSVSTLADMVGVSDRQIQRIARALEEQGAIVSEIGRGRRHTTIYGLLAGLSDEEKNAVIRDVKGDIAVSPINNGKGDIKHDTAMSPFIQEKVTFEVEKVTFDAIKGDIAVSPEPKGTEKRTEREHVERDSLFGPMFETIAHVCRIDLKLCTKAQRLQVVQTTKALRKAGKTPEDIPKVERWWYLYDWRGKKGDAPRPAQLQEVWQQATAGTKNGEHIRPSLNGHSERGKLSEADPEHGF